MITEQGRQAQAILAWVNEDPAARLPRGRARVSALATALMGSDPDGQPLRDVGDVATVLSRMAPAPALALAGTIGSQVIELDWDESRHPRDEHGRFTRRESLEARIKAHDTASRTASEHARGKAVYRKPPVMSMAMRTQVEEKAWKMRMESKIAHAHARIDKEVPTYKEAHRIAEEHVTENERRQRHAKAALYLTGAVAAGLAAVALPHVAAFAGPAAMMAAHRAVENSGMLEHVAGVLHDVFTSKTMGDALHEGVMDRITSSEAFQNRVEKPASALAARVGGAAAGARARAEAAAQWARQQGQRRLARRRVAAALRAQEKAQSPSPPRGALARQYLARQRPAG